MGVFRRARAQCSCGRDVSRDVTDTKAKSVKVECPCGETLTVELDRWWWCSYRFQGKVRRLRVAPDKRAAERKERECLIMVADGQDPAAEKVQSMTLPELAAAYWKAAQRRRPGYLEAEQRAVAQLTGYLGSIQIGQVTADRLEAWVASVQDDLSPATIRRKLAILSSMMGWGVRKGHLKARPRFPAIKVNNARNDWMTKEQAGELLSKITNPDTRDAVELALSTGMRRGELVGLSWEHVNLQGAVVSLPAALTKTNRPRSIPLNATATAVLKRRLVVARPGCRVFHRGGKPMSADGLSQQFKRAARAAGLDKLVLHSCRHTAASWLVQAGVDLMTTGALLGHTTLSMTQRYSHLSPDGLKAAIGAADFDAPPVPVAGVHQGETKILGLPQRPAASGEK